MPNTQNPKHRFATHDDSFFYIVLCEVFVHCISASSRLNQLSQRKKNSFVRAVNFLGLIVLAAYFTPGFDDCNRSIAA